MTNSTRPIDWPPRARWIAAMTAVLALATAPTALAAGSPWLPTPGGGNISVSYVSQAATEFYRAGDKVPTPGGGHNLAQQTIWVDGMYGLTDSLAIDFQVGESRSQYVTGIGPPTRQNLNGLADVSFGMTYRVVDEVITSGPSIAFRVGGIVAGNYEQGFVNSLGDGGSGIEVSGLIGKFIGNRVGLSGEIGYRYRASDVHEIPPNVFAKFSGGVLVGGGIGLSLNYIIDDSVRGLDIGGPGFSPAVFPELQEDKHLLGPVVSFAVSDSANVSVAYGKVVAGRNTAISDVFSVSFGFTFD